MRHLLLAATSALLAACSAQQPLERVPPQTLGTIQVPSDHTEGGLQYVYCVVGEGAYSCDRLRDRHGMLRPGEGKVDQDAGSDKEVSHVKLSDPLVLALQEEIKDKGETIRVHFPFDVSHLHESERNKLAANALRLRGKVISIFGFTDDLGSKKYNDALAIERAQSVAKFIREKIPGVTIKEVRGEGRCCYLESNLTEIERQQNRRAEVIIVLDKPRLASADRESKETMEK